MPNPETTAPPLKDALRRVRQYVEVRDEQPMPQLGDVIHAAHTGTRWMVELRLTDLRVVLEALENDG